MSALVRKACRLSETRLNEHRIHLTLDLSDNLPVYVTRMHIIVVLFNLVSNAIEAMSTVRGSRELRLTTQVTGDEKWIETIVKDTGLGISRDNMGRIFHPYFSTKAMKGRGLGLIGSRRTIESHNGLLPSPTSVYGKGTTFRILLPHATF